MSYCGGIANSYSYPFSNWISKFYYLELAQYLGRINRFGNLRNESEVDTYLQIDGWVKHDGEAHLSPILSRQYADQALNPEPGTDYCVEILDNADGVIDSHCFDLSFTYIEASGASEYDAFYVVLPKPANAAKIQLRKEAEILAERNVSANPPQVAITKPTGDETWGTAGGTDYFMDRQRSRWGCVNFLCPIFQRRHQLGAGGRFHRGASNEQLMQLK